MSEEKKDPKGKKKKEEELKAKVHEALKGLDIHINEFGEIESNFDIGRINDFLTHYVSDKKLDEREDIEKLKAMVKKKIKEVIKKSPPGGDPDTKKNKD
jgi:hypothetical protein